MNNETFRILRQMLMEHLDLSRELTDKEILEQIDELLRELTDRERQVLELRFGLKDGRPRTLEEVGKYFDVTRERIRQIEGKALTKLKKSAKSLANV